jgi:hypothetical protein
MLYSIELRVPLTIRLPRIFLAFFHQPFKLFAACVTPKGIYPEFGSPQQSFLGVQM